MKKLATVLFVLVLLFTSWSYAETMDLESLTLEELVDLSIRINEMIFERDQLNHNVLYPGTYIVGEDLDPGTYVFQCLKVDGGVNTKVKYGIDGEESILNDHDSNSYLEEGEVYQAKLEDNYYVRIEDGIVMAQKR